MTQDRARKKAVRARMAASGEPYSVAARKVPGGDRTALDEVMVCLASTLAALSVRLECRSDLHGRPWDQDARRYGPVVRLVSSAVKSAWTRLVPEQTRVRLSDAPDHGVSRGLAEPAARRYRLSDGGAATERIDDKIFIGKPGSLVRNSRHHVDMADIVPLHDPLKWLTSLLDATDARYEGDDTLRGTPCRKVIVGAGPAETAIWIDEEHVRQVQTLDVFADGSGSATLTMELWDFGVPVSSVDWTRFPVDTGEAALPG